MSAKETFTLPPYGEAASLSLELKRTVAKILYRVRLDPLFYQRCPGGNMLLEYYGMDDVAGETTVMEPEALPYPDLEISAMQTADYELSEMSAFEGLLYLFPSDRADEEKTPRITMDATYWDDDGITQPVRYRVPFNAPNGGEVRRNGFYLVNIHIAGLDEVIVSTDFSVKDWETLTVPPLTIGY